MPKVDPEVKNAVQAKLSAVKADVEKAEISKDVRIKMVDGKIMASFSVSGLPTEEKVANKSKMPIYESSYRNYDKIFDDWDSLKDYTEQFFNKEFDSYD